MFFFNIIPSKVFSVEVYEISTPEKFYDFAKNKLIFNKKCGLSLNIHRKIHIADPFLFIYNDELYLFYEVFCKERKGEIFAVKTTDLTKWIDLGKIMTKRFHLSYPFVFENDDTIYMIPEQSETRSISIYKSTKFPYKWEETSILIEGAPFVDSSIHKIDNMYFLFTTRINRGGDKTNKYTLELYYSENLLGNYKKHPSSPISNSLKNARNGGGILVLENKIYRIAQNCSNMYGENVSVYEILNITTNNYEESLLKENIFSHDSKKKIIGGHHLNILNFRGKWIIACDKQYRESFVNKLYERIHVRIKNLIHHPNF